MLRVQWNLEISTFDMSTLVKANSDNIVWWPLTTGMFVMQRECTMEEKSGHKEGMRHLKIK